MINRASRWFNLFVAASCLALCGCVPIAEHYYEPSTPDGVVSEHDCHGKAGAASDISLVRGTVTMLVATRYVTSSKLSIAVQIRLKENDHVIAKWDDMKVLGDDSKNLSTEISGRYAYVTNAGEIHAITLDPIAIGTLDGQKSRMYEVDAKIEGNLPDSFVFVLPAMSIDDVQYPAIKIMFNKKFGMWFMPINC